ncbi:MAG: DUF305 domain-containing protein [Actinomycetota bacterium]|nr:DUF305 domain-containing protein [Actinomycetota bacterium]MDZ4178242.1 DUF305 domain-containing protein [Coriobacteriia bacterium]
MRKATIPIVAAGLIIVGLIGIIATAAFLRPAGPYGDTEPGGARAGGMDAMFVEQMIPHHDDAIEMAELALTRAEHPEIRQLAADIKRTQTDENVQMRALYREWFGIEVPDVGGSSSMMGGMMDSRAMDMEDLEVADPFDKAFIEAMIPHHRMGIMMSQMARGATDRPELDELTSSIIEAQSTEITEMRTWYEEWYGR